MTQSKDDKTTTLKRGIWGFSAEEIHQMSWKFANFTSVAAVTSASIVTIQSPAKTFLVNLAKNGTAMPVYSGGIFGFARALYAGTGASLSGSVARTAYVTNAKNQKPVEVISEELVREEGKFTRAKMGYVLTAALGDIAITQIPESLSTLRKVPELLSTNFKWYTPYNAYQLMTGGFGARYASGMVNFTALCLFEDIIAQSLPVSDKKTKHFLAGAFSGVTAAVFSYPFTAFKDFTLVKSIVSPENQLSIPSASSIAKEMVRDFKANPTQVAKTAVVNSCKQLLVRAPLTGAIFATISVVGEALGPEPLKEIVPERFRPSTAKNPQGFFGGSSPRVEPVEEAAAQEAPTESATPK